MPVDQVCSATADAIGIRCVLKCADDVRVVGESEVVIAAKADDGFAVDDHVRLLRTAGKTRVAVEVLFTALSDGVA